MFLSDMCTVSGNKGTGKGYAKVNLTLDVTGKRPDGYHDIQTIMRTVNLYDTVTAELTKDLGIQLTTTLDWLPTDSKNIAYRAAQMLLEEVGAKVGVKLHIQKTIPCGAGMGGGSADGAIVLALLNRLLGNPVSGEKLLELGAKIGADVPFCLMCGTAIATGIGEKLEPLDIKGTVPVLVVKPEVSVSTPEMYRIIDECDILVRPDTKSAAEALKAGDIQALAKSMCNIMEASAINMHPVIGEIRDKMLKNGALGAMMTGSGSAVFGIFTDTQSADSCSKLFAEDFKDVYSTILL